jgi:hypothetical protein
VEGGSRPPKWAAGDGGVDSMLQFWLERGDNGMKHCRKMKRWQRARLGPMGRKRRQRARLGSMERKRNMAQRRGKIGQRRGGTEEGKGGDDASWVDTNLTGPKNK